MLVFKGLGGKVGKVVEIKEVSSNESWIFIQLPRKEQSSYNGVGTVNPCEA